jgi:hypothetical protein
MQCKNGWGFPFRARFKRAYPALLEFAIEQLLLHSSALIGRRALSPFKISLKGHFFMRNGITVLPLEFSDSFISNPKFFVGQNWMKIYIC